MAAKVPKFPNHSSDHKDIRSEGLIKVGGEIRERNALPGWSVKTTERHLLISQCVPVAIASGEHWLPSVTCHEALVLVLMSRHNGTKMLRRKHRLWVWGMCCTSLCTPAVLNDKKWVKLRDTVRRGITLHPGDDINHAARSKINPIRLQTPMMERVRCFSGCWYTNQEIQILGHITAKSITRHCEAPACSSMPQP